MVYFIFSPDDPRSLVKIGYTHGDPADRISQMQTGCPFRLALIMALEGGRRLELLLHHKFSRDRVHGEWFRPSDDLRRFIRDALGERFTASVAETMADPAAVERDAQILGWTADEVRAGLASLSS